MINTTSFVNAIEKVKHQLRINFDLYGTSDGTFNCGKHRERLSLPTEYGKSLIYQLLPFVFDELSV